MDLCMSGSFKCFLSWSCSIRDKFTFFRLCHWSKGHGGNPSHKKGGDEENIVHLSGFLSFITGVSAAFITGPFLAFPSFPIAADIPVEALIICPQAKLRLFQLLSATKDNSSSSEGLYPSFRSMYETISHLLSNRTSRLMSQLKGQPWCTRFQYGKEIFWMCLCL